MDSSSSTAEPQQSYPFPSIPAWTKPSSPPTAASSATAPTTAPGASCSSATRPTSTSVSSSKAHSAATSTPSTPYAPHLDGSADVINATSPSAGQYPSHVDLLPYFHWFPQQSSVYNAQLLHYNKLVSPSRGGGGGLQAAPLPPVVSASNAQAGPRSRSSSKVSLKDSSSGKGNTVGGHGSRTHHSSDKTRSVITPKEAQANKMARQQHSQDKGPDQPKNPIRKSGPAATQSQAKSSHSSSVPSTPHQRARHFSFESREPSPNEATGSHSPRSAYSETNSTLPSLRPLPPPRHGPCRYETAQINSRRRMPYSIGDDKLDSVDLSKIKGKLTKEEEKAVSEAMLEVYTRLKPSQEVEDKRLQLVKKLEKIFNDEWPNHDIQAVLFGSSGNLLCSDDSDVDICITTKWREMENVCMIADLLARRGMEKVVCISAAKVPIVKIWDPELGLACDMNVNNTTALDNTRMIRVYVEADPRVRQLMMIIKYWTRQRIINDAAFGGTLSSYTWICMIIAFLQLRTPPVSPTLHALPYKRPRPNGEPSEFADNVKKLKDYGKANPSTTADLLFQFFRFYAFEFNYDKYVLSVRSGTLMTKVEKGWTHSGNNQLCVEEPFNTSRNLGNTADSYAFRGLHLELRRAFDLLCEAKFNEACEPYVFPKEEERPTFRRPQAQSKPVMVRSASQTNTGTGSGSGRGGRSSHRGGRHNFRGGNGGSNRRASSSVPTYDNANMYGQAMHVQQDLSAWYSNPMQNPMFYTYGSNGEIMTPMSFQHQMYAQNSVYGQQQPMGHLIMSPTSSASQTQSTERSRTNSFDNQPAPLTAPLRPELFAVYGMAAMTSPLFTQNGAPYGAYTNSPSATANGFPQDFRRPLQRSGVSTDKGASASSSSLRSQSQPATRSPMQPVVPGQPLIPNSQSATSIPSVGASDPNGVPIPSFTNGTDFDETPKASMMSPRTDEAPQSHYFATAESSPERAGQARGQSPAADGSDRREASLGARKLSTEQLPQTILDRRMKRTSRSPSPLGHSRALSTGTTSAAAPVDTAAASRPLVVNGSGVMAPRAVNARAPSTGVGEHALPDYNVSKTENAKNPSVSPQTATQPGASVYPEPIPSVVPGHHPAVAQNGTKIHGNGMGPSDPSFRERVALMNSTYMNMPHFAQHPALTGSGQYHPALHQHLANQQPQNAVIAPLDLAISNDRVRKSAESDPSLLSPVYETLTPSPTSNRKPDFARSPQLGQQQAWSSALKQNLKSDEMTAPSRAGSGSPGSQPSQRSQPNQRPQEGVQNKTTKSAPSKSNGTKENGHTRGTRNDAEGGWQKAAKGKKKGQAPQTGGAEQPPKNASERKGG